MVTAKEQFSGQASPELLASIREIGRAEGRDFEAALEDAMREYIVRWQTQHPGVQPEALGHFRDSLERNRKLMELLAQSGG